MPLRLLLTREMNTDVHVCCLCQAQILKLLLIQMAQFRIVPLAYWSGAASESEGRAEGAVVELPLTEEQRALVGAASNGGKKKGQNGGRVTRAKKAAAEDEEMDEDEDDDDEEEEMDKVSGGMMLPPGLVVS